MEDHGTNTPRGCSTRNPITTSCRWRLQRIVGAGIWHLSKQLAYLGIKWHKWSQNIANILMVWNRYEYKWTDYLWLSLNIFEYLWKSLKYLWIIFEPPLNTLTFLWLFKHQHASIAIIHHLRPSKKWKTMVPTPRKTSKKWKTMVPTPHEDAAQETPSPLPAAGACKGLLAPASGTWANSWHTWA